MGTPGSETYKSTKPLETRDKNTYSSRKLPEVIAGPDVPEVGPAPTLASIEPNTLTVADPDTEVVVTGSGFTTESVIYWNGSDEATAFIDSEHVSTIVKPSTVQAPLPCIVPVAVRNGIQLSDPVSFTFTAPPEPEGGPMNRFWDKVKKTATCWLFTGGANSKGYGRFFVGRTDGRQVITSAPRMAWALSIGQIPAGLYVLHSCDTPACVNPSHLFLGTKKDNARDAKDKGRWTRGEKHGHSKLTEWDAREIRRRSDMPTIALAKAFMVHRSCICKIKSHESWRHLIEEGETD